MMRQAEEAHAAGEITDEQLATVEGIYDEWYETGIRPDMSSEGFEEGKVPKALGKFFDGKRGVSWSVRETETFKRDKYFDRQIDKWDGLSSGGYITVGSIKPDNPLHQVGIPIGKIYFDVNKIKNSMSSHEDHLST